MRRPTKVGPVRLPDGSWGDAATPEQLRRQVVENLRRLGVETLDLVNLRISRPVGPEEVADRFGALAEMRAEGLIRNLGLSNVRWEHVESARRIAPVVCVQNAFAVDLQRHFELLHKCGAEGIAFVPFFTIAGAGRETGPMPRAAIDATTTETAGAGDSIGPEWRIAAARAATGHQVRLAWTLHQGAHVLVIPGTGDVAHLEENVAAGALRLTADEMAAMGQR